MKPLLVLDDFLANPDQVRFSSIQSGYGSWRPTKGAIGSSVYDGLNFYGDHAAVVETVYKKAGFVGFPNSMCFRVTNETTEKAYVHSDIAAGDVTCIVYLSEHEDRYGTGFYRHKESGALGMKRIADIPPDELKQYQSDSNDFSKWEEIEFVQGSYNRAVIFESARFHRRFPDNGFGADEHSGRMIHITHFKHGQLP